MAATVLYEGLVLIEISSYLLFVMSKSIDHEFSDRLEWRKWLEKNCSSKKEVWVIIFRRSSGNNGLRYEEAVEEAICFGWIDGKMQSVDASRFR
jgi:uncharacterized protein YdeI (YjbR/CyaY-like superfamily)